jgi:hypothetical protein
MRGLPGAAGSGPRLVMAMLALIAKPARRPAEAD